MTDPHDDMAATAGEYVLGTLDPTGRAAFAARLLADPAARAAVAAWEERLAPLLADAPGVTPPAGLWNGIEARIGAAGDTASNDNRVSPVWRGAAIAASLVAVLGGTLAMRPQPVAAPPVLARGASYVAAVTAKGAEPALLVTIDRATGHAVVRAIGLTAPARKSLELWYIGPGRDPRSLGLVSGDMRAEMPLAPMLAKGDRLGAALFAITAEPAGGAPAGAPTGEILYSGKPMMVSAS
ncbi:anti-sigma factor [Sphingomonas solaris]|uniref:Regulator of SigK n=1 Tax=Alterirhizorhabdus solaris TaxID=2529389 RepID=A0A558R258_9SPHN|nr:anti-sigma factor [Sphingomonas solaris]TVV73471.1 hypothetical protein FOY91_12080 [Sphingomonas solaris]